MARCSVIIESCFSTDPADAVAPKTFDSGFALLSGRRMMHRMPEHRAYRPKSLLRHGECCWWRDFNRRLRTAAAERSATRVSRRFDGLLLSLIVITVGSLSTPSSAAAKIRLACIGDSITEGAGASLAYPARFARLLGAEYDARNFGVSGCTLLKKGDMPYWSQSAFNSSLAFQPNIVVIMLGSNDAKPQNWRYATNFVSDYLDLISRYANLTSSPSIYLCTPCPPIPPGAFNINPATVQTSVVPAVRLVSAQSQRPLIDVNGAMFGHKEWFPDLIHPNDSGAAVLAAVIYSGVRDQPGVDLSPPLLSATSGSPGRIHVSWPVAHAGMVLESVGNPLLPTDAWSVITQAGANSGTSVTISNLSPGNYRLYRLHRFASPN